MTKNQFFKTTTLLFTLVSVFFLTSCSKDEIKPEDENIELDAINVKDLDGLTNGSVHFSLEQQKEVNENSEDWDIKIAGTTISFGNGASGQLVEGVFASYNSAPEDGYSSSDIGGSNSYYTYTNATEPQHAVLMKPGMLIIIKTGKGKFAKLEMLSYYKGNPNTTTAEFADLATRAEKQHFTFNYVLQSDGSRNF